MEHSQVRRLNKARELLLNYSVDVIASSSLLANYDAKEIAYAIDALMGEHGPINDINFNQAVTEHMEDLLNR